LVVTVVGFGSYYTYRSYRKYKWFKNMTDSDNSIGTKPRIVVLGTGEYSVKFFYFYNKNKFFLIGWGAVPLLKHLDTNKYEVVCVSPRNYFLMTPLLPSVSVGTVETRTVIESIRSLVGPRVKYVEAHCVDVDPKAKTITCNSDGSNTVARGDNIKTIMLPSKREGGASSRMIKDSG
jgi:hypothetical protein